jgi:stage II sporulation protein B
VDKPNKGNTIKIKLNGENQPFQEEQKKNESEARIESTGKVIKIYPNLSESDVFFETAAAQESVDESFDWIIPESSENDIEEFKIASNNSPQKSGLKKLSSFSTNTKKKNERPVGSILISATFAILIGLTIGFIMLKLVITESSDKVTTEPTVVKEKGVTESKTTAGKTTTAVIKQLTTYVIQEGVYSSQEGAKETSTQLTSKGVPSQFVDMNGKHYLFLGVADSIETAKSLGVQYKEKGVKDVFAKPILLDEKKFSDITEKEKTFLEAVPTIYQTLSIATSSALVTKEIPKEASKALAGIKEQLNVSGIKNEKVKKLKTELASADEKLKGFQKLKDAKSLSEAQQHLLNFLSLYFSM